MGHNVSPPNIKSTSNSVSVSEGKSANFNPCKCGYSFGAHLIACPFKGEQIWSTSNKLNCIENSDWLILSSTKIQSQIFS